MFDISTLQLNLGEGYYYLIYIILIWPITVMTTKILHSKGYDFDVKFYQIIILYFNTEEFFLKLSEKIKHKKIISNFNVIVGIVVMGFGFWVLLNNILNFYFIPENFSEFTILASGVTVTSTESITYFTITVVLTAIITEISRGIIMATEKIRINGGIKIDILGSLTHFIQPEIDSFNEKKLLSRLRVICSGPSSLILFSFLLSVILLTNPFFAMVLPEPLLSTFYDLPEGVLVLSIIENSGAEKAGLITNDIITSINNKQVFSPADFPILDPGDIANVTVIRDGYMREFDVEITPSPNDPEVGLIGIMRDTTIAYKPIFHLIEWNNPHFSMFLLWLWMISFFLGLISMMPLPFVDGGKFIQNIIMAKISEKRVKIIMWIVYSFTLALFVFNVILTYMRAGLPTI